MARILLLVLLFVSGSALAADENKAVLSTLRSYREAMKTGNAEAVGKLTAFTPDRPKEAVQGFLTEVVVQHARVRMWIFSQSVMIEGDCAVVVIGDHERPKPDDPAYLMRMNGGWKVMPEVTKFDSPFVSLSPEQKAAFAFLQRGYEAAQDALRKANPKTWNVE